MSARAAILMMALAVQPAAAKPLAVYDALSGQLTLVDDLGGHRALPCVQLGKWSRRIDVRDGQLLVLDTEHHALLAVELAALAAGCKGELPVRRVPLHGGKLPYHARLGGDRVYVTYFGDNLVEVYRWPGLGFEREIVFPAAENLGLSDLDADGNTLYVAATGYVCYERECPNGRYRASHVFFLDTGGPMTPPFRDARPSNLNTASVIARPPYAINAGDLAGGYGSLQRIASDRSLGPEIRLPRGSGPALARAVGPHALVVAQMSGEHLFLVDTEHDKLRAILRFDGHAFRPLPLDSAALPERADADFQDVLVEAPDHLWLVDAKGERLVRARLRPDFSLVVEAVTPLGTGNFRSNPAWAVRLP